MIGGVLPFGSIFIEMYFIFTSFWAYKIYYVRGLVLLCVWGGSPSVTRHACSVPLTAAPHR